MYVDRHRWARGAVGRPQARAKVAALLAIVPLVVGTSTGWAAQASPHITADYAVPLEAGLTVGAGAVWFASQGANGVVALDPKSGGRLATIPLGVRVDTSNQVYVGAVGMGAVWLLDVTRSVLYRIDAKKRAVSARFKVDFADRLAIAAGSVWLTSNLNETVQRLDPASGKVIATIHVPTPTRLAFGQGALWVLGSQGSLVARIDPSTNRVVATTRVKPAEDIAAGPAGVWISDKSARLVSRLDTSTNKVADVVSVPSGASPLTLAEAGGWLWMTSGGCDCGHRGKPMVFGVNPAKRQVAASLKMPVIVSDIAVGEGAIWAADNDLGHLFKIAYR